MPGAQADVSSAGMRCILSRLLCVRDSPCGVRTLGKERRRGVHRVSFFEKPIGEDKTILMGQRKQRIFKSADRCAIMGCLIPSVILALLLYGIGLYKGASVFALFCLFILVSIGQKKHVRASIRAHLGWGLSSSELSKRLQWNWDELRLFKCKYKEALIPKRRGGHRKIFIPNETTKKLQRQILRRLLSRLRVHSAAHGFEEGRSIFTNACIHVQQKVVISLDIKDFFQNTRKERVEAYFRRIGWNEACARLLSNLLTHEDALPQGSPCSPKLSNLLNYGLDAALESKIADYRGKYSRYADDITISFPKDYPQHIRGMIQKVRRELHKWGYELNDKKTRIMRAHQRQLVTGLVVNERVNLPRSKRRLLRAIEHRLAKGSDGGLGNNEGNGGGNGGGKCKASLSREQLAGWKAFAQQGGEALKESF